MKKFHRFYELGLGIVIGVSAILVITSFTMAVQSYESVGGGYKILRNNGIVTISAQGKTVVVDTSKIDRDMFIPTNSAAELQSFASSTAYTTVSGPVDTTAPTITFVSATHDCMTPINNLTVVMQSSENGQVKMDVGKTIAYGQSTAWTPITAGVNATMSYSPILVRAKERSKSIIQNSLNGAFNFLIRDVHAGPPPQFRLYYRIYAQDGAGNESTYTGNYVVGVCPS